MRAPLELVLIGAGQRGRDAFGPVALAHPDRLKFVAVAEPDPVRRDLFADLHGIPPARRFASWEDLAGRAPLAPALVNATQDRMHVPSTLALLAAGYHVLLEKPMAVDPADCVRIADTAERAGKILQIAHVLRYNDLFARVRRLLDEDAIGEVVSIHHAENVGFWHYAHSYVRGNWGREDASAPMLLAKSCHDMDLLLWLVGRPSARIASFGSLTHFRAERAPEGAPARCTDGCPHEPECPYSALRMYVETSNTGWPVSTITTDLSPEGRLRAVQEGPYGRCVWRHDNDVVDHQVVIAEFAGGATATFSMCGHTAMWERTIKIMGTKGEIRATDFRGEIEVRRFHPFDITPIRVPYDFGTHGGGDHGLLLAFVDAVTKGDATSLRTDARTSVESHLMCFAAERARRLGTAVDMKAYAEEMRRKV
jgi:predicted dehydrogenase